MSFKKVLGVFIALALAAGLGMLLQASPAKAAGPKPASVSAGSIWGTAPTAAPLASLAAVGCPVGDGPVSWGKGKVCPDGAGARVHFQDSLTDGYCVEVRYWSDDQGAWRQQGSDACTTGQWVSFYFEAHKACAPNARLYRSGTGTYFTMPNTLCP